MLSKEQKAKIARTNGAKSRGPKSQKGKAHSRLNSLKTGDYATKLALFLPPAAPVLCNEDRQAFASLLTSLLQSYNPQTQEAAEVVRQIAIARWTVNRLQNEVTNIWSLSLLEHAAQPATVVKELEDTQTSARTAISLFSSAAPVERLNRQIDRLELRITRLRASLPHIGRLGSENPKEINNIPPERTEPTDTAKPAVYVTEATGDVLEAYRREFPRHRIILLPPDNVAKGIETKDKLPPAPRKAA